MTVTVMGKADTLLFPQSGHPISVNIIQHHKALLDASGTTIHTDFSSGSEPQR